MANGILVFAEHRAGAFNKTTFEALAAAQQLGELINQDVSAVVLGSNVEPLARQISAYKLAKVVYAENDKLAEYTPDAYADAMQRVIEQQGPSHVILPHTYLVRDFAPKLAARFRKDLISDCLRFKVENETVVFSRRVFLGKIDADVVPQGAQPTFATFQSGAFRSDHAVKGEGAAFELLSVEVGEVRMQPEPAFQEVKQAVDLSRSEIIVAVGRGIKAQEHLGIAENLAAALNGELAASRPICDAGWLPIDRQIGSSGQTVAPKLYVALGISGAIQHLVGMKNAGTIVAVNKDPEAPIFDIADYGIVGDLFEVVPALTEEIKKLRG
ncbi:MAG: electron transfer flavoprotein subunit alpha/FixB family protein [Pyrinomonadaceae bacterium]